MAFLLLKLVEEANLNNTFVVTAVQFFCDSDKDTKLGSSDFASMQGKAGML